MDDEFVEPDEAPDRASASRWRWSLIPLHGLTFVASVCSDASDLFGGLAQEVASHYNYQSRREFAEEANRELETLLGGDDG